MTLPKPLPGLIGTPPLIHNGALATRASVMERASRALLPGASDKPLWTVETGPEMWSDALSFPLRADKLHLLDATDAVVIELRILVRNGVVGVGATAEDGSTFVSNERVVSAGAAPATVRIWIREPKHARHLMFRNVAPVGTPSRFALLELRADVVPGALSFVPSWSSPAVKTIAGHELRELVSWAAQHWDMPFGAPPPASLGAASIEIVESHDLPLVLGLPEPTEPSRGADKSLADWKMETDDAPLLKDLWRARAPRRHLEFGTWEGFGATLVASHSPAEIWTLNLPDGELAADGIPLYADGDAGHKIGWKYRDAGYSQRIHQVLCDSRTFDTRPFEPAFFDTVLIDGGHTPDVVENDTEKALRVLRPGGLMVWHDFCPDPDALARNVAPLGVVHAVASRLDSWRPLFGRLYWIRKSWILVGERNSTPCSPRTS